MYICHGDGDADGDGDSSSQEAGDSGGQRRSSRFAKKRDLTQCRQLGREGNQLHLGGEGGHDQLGGEDGGVGQELAEQPEQVCREH